MEQGRPDPKRWGVAIAALYAAMLVVLTWPILMVAFHPEIGAREAAGLFGDLPYWGVVAMMAVAQVALLSIPVGVLRRPTTRRSILAPIAGAGFACGVLAVGAAASFVELAEGEGALEHLWAAGLVGLAAWAGWGFSFHRWSSGHSGENLLDRQAKLLFRGSVLELLIAVPTHVVARGRDYCCAGVMTFIGITAGVAVMLFSFGPAVYFLYRDRWRRVKRSS